MNAAELFRSYGAYGFLRLAIDVAWTRFCFPSARVVRRPFYIRGIKGIDFGHGFTSGPGLRIDALSPTARISIGANVQVNNNVHIAAIDRVAIGNGVLIASNVFIADHNHGSYAGRDQSDPTVPPAQRRLSTAPVDIGDDTWLGEHACILPGVVIGRGVVVGAGSVVTAALPDFVIAVGSPARIIKRFDFQSKVWVPEK